LLLAYDGCYRCATVDSVIKTADKHKVRLILIEDGSVTINKDWNWTDKFLKPLKEYGYDIHVINFSKGVPRAILEIGKVLGRKDKAMDLAREYTRSLKRIRNAIPATRADKKILKSWQAVLKANPDIIVTYGNSYTVQKSLVRALKRRPELARVTAIRDHAVYALPFYMDSSVTQYPKILKVWVDAVYRE
jgi:ABC-type Fe3+-hydroxamate transport system substrate-binding protein